MGLSPTPAPARQWCLRATIGRLPIYQGDAVQARSGPAKTLNGGWTSNSTHRAKAISGGSEVLASWGAREGLQGEGRALPLGRGDQMHRQD